MNEQHPIFDYQLITSKNGTKIAFKHKSGKIISTEEYFAIFPNPVIISLNLEEKK